MTLENTIASPKRHFSRNGALLQVEGYMSQQTPLHSTYVVTYISNYSSNIIITIITIYLFQTTKTYHPKHHRISILIYLSYKPINSTSTGYTAPSRLPLTKSSPIPPCPHPQTPPPTHQVSVFHWVQIKTTDHTTAHPTHYIRPMPSTISSINTTRMKITNFLSAPYDPVPHNIRPTHHKPSNIYYKQGCK